MLISRLLDSPILWNVSRTGLNLVFGLYRQRKALLAEWGVLDGSPSIIDLGCGTGQYSDLTGGAYVGIDNNPAYIDYARRTNSRQNATFRCVDVADLLGEDTRYDVALMVDFLHHLPDESAVALLKQMKSLAGRYVVSFEPIVEQTSVIGRWIIKNDRGDFMRPREHLKDLYNKAGLDVIDMQDLRLGPIVSSAALARGLVDESL
jgi:2-polyprenyl-3-methyl-5-hydroxy-6-metoxy-1,4-benzoquinol methylase